MWRMSATSTTAPPMVSQLTLFSIIKSNMVRMGNGAIAKEQHGVGELEKIRNICSAWQCQISCNTLVQLQQQRLDDDHAARIVYNIVTVMILKNNSKWFKNDSKMIQIGPKMIQK